MKTWTDTELDAKMGRLLQLGVMLSASVMLIGAAVFLYHNGRSVPAYHTFRRNAPTLRTVRGILSQALQGDGSGLIQLAVLLIIATPVARVIFAAYSFLRERDWLYTCISMTVLSLLIYGLVHGG
jgi:uncharacterized membrane protein